MENINIKNHLDKSNLDIRTTGDARFMDQKVTPDVLSIISDCVINFVLSKNNKDIEFTSKDIWNYEYSDENIGKIFNKPSVLNDKAIGEYNKFFQQPLKMLSYANILSCKKIKNQNYFKIENYELLEYISTKEKNAFNFLVLYLEKTLKDSGIWYLFEDFIKNNTRNNFKKLKDGYISYIITYTQIKKPIEPSRIFTKILNPLACEHKSKGTEKGRMSNDFIGYNNLMYNRKNWRDLEKLKGETREEYEFRIKNAKIIQEEYSKYSVQKAKNIVKRLHYPESEVKDQYAVDEATTVHHIFKESDYPEISDYLENLILLTENQHRTHAHRLSNFLEVDRDYQLTCIISKSDSIEKTLLDNKNIYSKNDFCYVLDVGLKLKLNPDLDFSTIKYMVIDFYNRN